MQLIKKITVVVTNLCNSRCSDCYTRSKDVKKMIMTRDIISSIHDLFGSFGRPKHLTISGGEPTLVLNEVSELLSGTEDINTKIITNGWWGGEDDVKTKLSDIIMATNLNTIQFSCGIEHQRWVNIDRVISAVRYILEGTTKTNVELMYEIKDRADIQNIKRLFGDFKNRFGERFRIITGYWNNIKDDQYENGRACIFETASKNWCDKLSGANIVVKYDGTIYRCCGAFIVGAGNPYLMGNILKAFSIPFTENDGFAGWFRDLNLHKEENIRQIKERGFLSMHKCEQCTALTEKYYEM